MLDRPEVWVPTIVVLLERYHGNQDATSAVLYRLVQMGLVRPVVDPNARARSCSTWGSSTGRSRIRPAGHHRRRRSRRRGEIWTPEAARGGAAIWTPGSDAAPAPASGQERSASSCPGSDRVGRAEIGSGGPSGPFSARKERPDVLDVA